MTHTHKVDVNDNQKKKLHPQKKNEEWHFQRCDVMHDSNDFQIVDLIHFIKRADDKKKIHGNTVQKNRKKKCSTNHNVFGASVR